jgi:hypothetical protein
MDFRVPGPAWRNTPASRSGWARKSLEDRRDLRTEDDPNYDGVARLLAGEDAEVRTLPLQPGTLYVFAGHDAAHRVTPIEGARQRLIAVPSFMNQPDVMFTPEDRVQFYGRAG